MRYNEKMKFVNDLLNRYYPKGNHSIWIWMGFVRPKTLYMAIYAIITEYEATHGAGIAENHTEESN